jgi:hypothetical protein
MGAGVGVLFALALTMDDIYAVWLVVIRITNRNTRITLNSMAYQKILNMDQ